MTFLPLTFGTGRKPGAGREGFLPSQNQIEKTLRRDDNTCRFCGFSSTKFQRVLVCPEAGDPPFATACTFCEQVLNLERTGIIGSGLLIWLPEISQTDLHHMLRAIYAARAEKGPMALLATRALDALTARRAEAKKRLGADDPLLLATIFEENLDEDERKAALTKLEGIRLLPAEKHLMRGAKGDTNMMPRMAKFWLTDKPAYARYPTQQWPDLFKKAMAATGTA